jgi:chromosome segregation ATPase
MMTMKQDKQSPPDTAAASAVSAPTPLDPKKSMGTASGSGPNQTAAENLDKPDRAGAGPEQNPQQLRAQEMARKRKQLEREEWGRKQQEKHDREILTLAKQLDAAKSANQKTGIEHRDLVKKMRTLISKMTAVKQQSDEKFNRLESEFNNEHEKRLAETQTVNELSQLKGKLEQEIKAVRSQLSANQTAIDQLSDEAQTHSGKNTSLQGSVAKLKKQLAAEQQRLASAVGAQEEWERGEIGKLQERLDEEKRQSEETVRNTQENFAKETDSLKSSERKLRAKLKQATQDSEQQLVDERRQSSEQIGQLEEQLTEVSAKLESTIAELDSRLSAEREAKESATHALAMETEDRVQAEARIAELDRMLKSETDSHTRSFKKASRLTTERRLMQSRVDELNGHLDYERQANTSLTTKFADVTESERNFRLKVADLQASLAVAERSSSEAGSNAETLLQRLKAAEAKAADQHARLRSESERTENLESNLANERADLTTSEARGAEVESLYETEREENSKLREEINALGTERDDLEVRLATVDEEFRGEAEARRGFEKERNFVADELNEFRSETIQKFNQHEDFREQAASNLEECLMEVNRHSSDVQAEFSKINAGRRKLIDAIAALGENHQESEAAQKTFQEQWDTENERLTSLIENILQFEPAVSEEPEAGAPFEGVEVSSGPDQAEESTKEAEPPDTTVPDFLSNSPTLPATADSKPSYESKEDDSTDEAPNWLSKFSRKKT